MAVAGLMAITSVLPAKELLYLGHTTSISSVRISGNYVLSHDIGSNWILWDYAEKKPIISGSASNVDLKGNSLVVGISQTSLIYRLPDLNPITVPLVNVALSTDGEYLLSNSAGELRVWNLDGDLRLTERISYNNNLIISANNHLLIAAKGGDSIIAYPIPSFENPQVIRFTGKFVCWMKEGETFLSLQGDTVYLCRIDGTSKILKNNLNYAYSVDGCGSYVWWTTDPQEGYTRYVSIQNIEKSDAPITQTSLGNGTFKVSGYLVTGAYYINLNVGPARCGDLYGVPLVFYKFTPDSVFSYMHDKVNFNLKGFDCDSAGNWVGGNEDGLIFCGKVDDLTAFTCLNQGKVRSIHGTPDNKMAIATSSGKIMTYDFSSGNGVALDTIDRPSSKILLSIDGKKLFALSYDCRSGIRMDSSTISEILLSSEIGVNSWGYRRSSPHVGVASGLSISDNGSVIGWAVDTFNNAGRYQKSVIYDGSRKKVLVLDSSCSTPQLSPSGRFSALQCDTLVKIYGNDTLITTLKGKLGGWLSDSSLIMNRYGKDCRGSEACALYWQAGAIFRVNGDSLPEYKLPELMMNTAMISDSVAFYSTGGTKFNEWNYNSFKIADIRQGTILCSLSTHGPAFPVGPDYIVYQSDTALELINWHELVAVARPSSGKKPSLPGRARFTVAGNKIHADFTISDRESPIFSMFSLRGELLARTTLGPFAPGSHHVEIPASALNSAKHPGKSTYVAVLKTGAATVAEKVMW